MNPLKPPNQHVSDIIMILIFNSDQLKVIAISINDYESIHTSKYFSIDGHEIKNKKQFK